MPVRMVIDAPARAVADYDSLASDIATAIGANSGEVSVYNAEDCGNSWRYEVVIYAPKVNEEVEGS